MSRSGHHAAPAIVVGLDSMPGIQTARILARHGIPVIAIAADRRHPNCRTSVCERILYADTNSEAFVAALEEMGPALPARAVVYPCHDMAVRTLSQHRTRLAAWYHVALAPEDVIDRLTDKIRLYRHAQDTGLPIPQTFFLDRPEDARAAAQALEFPGILKPAVRSPQWHQHTKKKAFRVDDAEELLALFAKLRPWTTTLILQRYVAGGDDCLYSCNCYIDAGGKALATFIARKVRQWPPGAGSSSLGVECREDAVLEQSLRLFASLDYRGLGYVEMKKDADTGELFLIEPNVGRPTGRGAIAEAGGVEILYTMYCDLTGAPLPNARVQRYGNAKWLDVRHDLQSAWYYWRRRELTIGAWLRSWRGRKAYALFDWRDPKPFLADLARVVRLKLTGRRFVGAASRRDSRQP